MRSFWVVDFPAPLGPRKPKISPRPTEKSIPRTAGSVAFGYVKVSPRTRITSVMTLVDVAAGVRVCMSRSFPFPGRARRRSSSPHGSDTCCADQTSRRAESHYTELSEIFEDSVHQKRRPPVTEGPDLQEAAEQLALVLSHARAATHDRPSIWRPCCSPSSPP